MSGSFARRETEPKVGDDSQIHVRANMPIRTGGVNEFYGEFS